MTKIHSGVQIGAGFAYKGTDWNFSRDYYETYKDLIEDTEAYDFPTNFTTIVNSEIPSEIEPDPNFKEDYTYPFLVLRNSKSSEYPWRLAGDLNALSRFRCDANAGSIIMSADLDLKGNDIWNVSESSISIFYTNNIYADDPAEMSDTKVWNTNGGTVDLTTYAKKTDIPSLSGYVTSTSLNSTLTAYAKLADANFTALKVGGNSVATQTWTNTQIASAVSQALKYKGGIATQSDITTAEASLAVGYVYVCTTAGNYTINGGTTYLEVGDTLICKDATATVKWTVVQANITGAVTKQTDLVANQLVLGNNASSVKPLAAGSNGTILKMVSGVPTWSTEYSYSLPTASTSTKGGITLGYTTSGKNYAVQLDANGKAYVNVPWTDNNTTYSVFKGATASAAGSSGLVPAPASGATSLFLKSDGTWATPTDTKYTLPAATTSALGGIKLGSTYSGQEPDTSSYFYLQKDSNNVGYVDLSNEKLTDTTYSISANDATITLTGSDGSTKSVSVNKVANATYASNANVATKVVNNLTIQQLDSTGISKLSTSFNGNDAVTIAAVSYTEIDALFA